MNAFLHVRPKCLDAFAGARWLGALPWCGLVVAMVVVLVGILVARVGALGIWSMVMVLVGWCLIWGMPDEDTLLVFKEGIPKTRCPLPCPLLHLMPNSIFQYYQVVWCQVCIWNMNWMINLWCNYDNYFWSFPPHFVQLVIILGRSIQQYFVIAASKTAVWRRTLTKHAQ